MNIVKSLNSVSCIHRNRPPQCDHCPTKYNLTSWREKEDVEFSVTSDQNSALVKYDFEKLYKAGRYPGWMSVAVRALLGTSVHFVSGNSGLPDNLLS